MSANKTTRIRGRIESAGVYRQKTLLLAMADFGAHTTLLASDFATAFSGFLRSHDSYLCFRSGGLEMRAACRRMHYCYRPSLAKAVAKDHDNGPGIFAAKSRLQSRTLSLRNVGTNRRVNQTGVVKSGRCFLGVWRAGITHRNFDGLVKCPADFPLVFSANLQKWCGSNR